MCDVLPGKALIFLASWLLFSPSGFIGAEEKQHPSLVDPKTAKCETCHGDLLQGNVHPIVKEGCDNCHTMERVGEKTMVSAAAKGNELCGVCHQDQASKASLPNPHPALEDCRNCHDAHASKNEQLLLKPLPEICFGCHEEEALRKSHKDQPIQGTKCVGCHDPHGNDESHFLTGKVKHPPFAEGACDSCHRKSRGTRPTFVSRQPDLCYACHSDKDKSFVKKNVHKPVKDGKCTECHSPHLAGQKHLLKASIPELCFRCHTDVQQAVKEGFSHPPAADDCRNCHAVHSSDRPHLLREDMLQTDLISGLCAACHDLDDLKPKHREAEMKKTACTTCHNPHGSSAKKIINTISVHPPFQEDCDICHSKGASLSEQPPQLCFTCHDDVREAVEKASEPHPAVEMGCTSCHTPHASSHKPLFASDMISTCGGCHDDLARRMTNEAFVHGAVTREGCQVCHQPHGGTLPKLLKKRVPDLCLDCHQQGTAEKAPKIMLDATLKRDHPLKGHSVEPKGGSCLSCHDPHSGQSQFLFVNQIKSETQLCATCHPK